MGFGSDPAFRTLIPPSRRTEEKDRKSTRLNSSHRCISYADFCLKKKHVIIVMVTLQFEFDPKRRASELRANDFLNKPFQSIEVLDRHHDLPHHDPPLDDLD